MTQEFIPYQEALEMKQLGFDEPCLGSWEVEKSNTPIITYSITKFYTNSTHPMGKVTTPTYSQAFKWLREKYNLHVYIGFYHKYSYFYKIESQIGKKISKSTGDIILQDSPLFPRAYEEAELACLRKLIELVKSKV